MTATGHAVIGTALAAVFPNPFIGIPLAIISHPIADKIPHWDTGTNYKKKSRELLVVHSTVDVLLGFLVATALVAWLFPHTNLVYAYTMVIAAQTLDWLWAPYFFLKWKFPLFKWSYDMGVKYFDSRLDKPWGIIIQVLVLLGVLIAARHFAA